MNVSETLLSLEHTPEAVAQLARTMLEVTSRDERALLEESDGFFLEEATRILLGWMGRGENEAVGELATCLSRVLSSHPAGLAAQDNLSRSEWLWLRVRELARFAAVYQRTNNAAKYGTLLLSPRRARWRTLMAWAYKVDRPFTARELRSQTGLFSKRAPSANEALESLRAEGLLVKRETTGGNVTYELTWKGRMAVQAAVDPEELERMDEVHHDINQLQGNVSYLLEEVNNLKEQIRTLKRAQERKEQRSRMLGVSGSTRRQPETHSYAETD